MHMLPGFLPKVGLISLILILALAAAACGAAPAQEADTGEEAIESDDMMDDDGAYGESPLLAARVAAGELPPVEERLPIQPFCSQPTHADCQL